MTETTKRPSRAKRRLSDISFEREGAHVALVSKDQGHGANGHHYALVMKAANFSEEFMQKASKIKVEMDVVEYLQRFYNIYGEDAEVLARALGFTTKRQEKYALEQQEDMLEEQEQMIDPERPSYDSDEKEWEDYITSRVGSLEIMKALYEADSVAEVISGLDEDEYLMFLQDQQMLEKAFKQIDKQKKKESKSLALQGTTESKSVVKQQANDASDEGQLAGKASKVKSDDEASASDDNRKLEKSMTKEVETQVIEQEVEVVAKAQFDAISKALEEQKTELQKALDLVKAYEAEKKEAILKARKLSLVDAVADEAKAETLFKALKDSAEEDFEAVVKTLKEIQVSVDKSALFEEQGASVQEDDVVQESAVAKILKAKQRK